MYSPVYVFHPNERYFPLCFSTYVEGCSLMKRDTPSSGTIDTPAAAAKTLVAYPNLKVEDLTNGGIDPLLKIESGPDTTKSIYLKIEDTTMAYGSSPFYCAKETNHRPPAVQYVYPTVVQVDSTVYVDLLFNLLYGYNCMAGDDHQFDSEYVIVRVRVGNAPVAPTSAMELIGMWTSRHGGGGWYTTSELRLWEDTHPVSYVALGSHANYVSPGIQRRLWGFGNDICAENVGSCSVVNVFAPACVQLTKPGDAAFPGANTSEYRYMAYVGQTCGGEGGHLMAWNPRYLNTIQTPPQKASDDTSVFIKKEVPGIGQYTFWGVVALLVLVITLEGVVFAYNAKSVGHATWQQLFIVTFAFVAGVFATYASLLR